MTCPRTPSTSNHCFANRSALFLEWSLCHNCHSLRYVSHRSTQDGGFLPRSDRGSPRAGSTRRRRNDCLRCHLPSDCLSTNTRSRCICTPHRRRVSHRRLATKPAGPPHRSRTCDFCCHSCTSYSSILRSEEHTSELQSLMRISYAVFCLKKK